ncbi:hypothetical protein MPLSOD_50173 [Mesorhizobium sp. SOD10]|nr:hypothetical protein MPLSOD_50173 [Mesorhizobium sp. SOD10]
MLRRSAVLHGSGPALGGSSRQCAGPNRWGLERKTWHRLNQDISGFANFFAMRTKDAGRPKQERPDAAAFFGGTAHKGEEQRRGRDSNASDAKKTVRLPCGDKPAIFERHLRLAG